MVGLPAVAGEQDREVAVDPVTDVDMDDDGLIFMKTKLIWLVNKLESIRAGDATAKVLSRLHSHRLSNQY